MRSSLESSSRLFVGTVTNFVTADFDSARRAQEPDAHVQPDDGVGAAGVDGRRGAGAASRARKFQPGSFTLERHFQHLTLASNLD